MSIMHLLTSNGFITVNKHLARTLGLDEAVIFGEMCGKYDYREARGELDENGYFFCTVEDLEDTTTLGERRQRKAINNLVEIGLIKQVTKGLPRKRFFKINENAVLAIFSVQSLQNAGQSSRKTQDTVPAKCRINKNTHNKNTEQEYSNKKYIEKEGYRGKVNNIPSDKFSEEIKEQSQKTLPPPPKSPHGEFGNVFLSDDEHKGLIDRYGTTATESYIGQLDRYMQKDFAVKARYARRNHYAVVVDWIEKDRVKKKVTTKVDIEQPFIPSSELPNDDWKDFISTADLIKMGYKF